MSERTKKVVINRCFGGFSISEKALYRMAELKGISLYPENNMFGFKTYWTVPNPPEGILDGRDFYSASEEERQKSNNLYDSNTFDIRPENREDADLIKTIEELGDEANGKCADLKIVEIPDGIEYTVEEYDGLEHIAEKHRVWF